MNETLYHTNFLELKSTPSKNGKPWVYAHRPNAKNVIVVLPICKEEVLFLIEERPPLQAENKGKFAIGIAAGLVGDERMGESSEEALQAELLEETGLVAKSITVVANNVASSAGCVSETFTIALAEIENKEPIQAPIDDGGVIIDRVWIKKDNIHLWLNEMESKGYVLTSQSLAALFYLYK